MKQTSKLKKPKKIDYNQFVTRDHIDWKAYEEKFTFTDEALAETPFDPIKLMKICGDVTTFSYAFFKLDGKRLKLYPYQDMILNDPHRYKIFRAARQIGKSLALDIKAAYNICIDHGHAHNECIISISLDQSKFQMRRVKTLLNNARFEWSLDKGSTDNVSIITVDVKDETDKNYAEENRPQRVKYTNMLVCTPCTEGSLGYDFHEVNLDEFEYWDIDTKYFFNRIIEPTIFHTKGNISIFSNPNGSDNLVADFEVQDDSEGNRMWHTYVFNFLDCPVNTKKEWDDQKNRKTRVEFESTVAAIRSASDRCYFTPDEIEGSFDKNLRIIDMVGKQPFFFLDIGAKHDQSCLVGGFTEPDESKKFQHIYIPIIHLYPVGYPLTRVVGVEVDDSDGWHYEKSVKEYMDEWGADGIMPVFGYDITGNQGMKALFEAIGIIGEDVVFSGPKKSGYYQRFKYFMEKGLLHRIKHKVWAKQASELIMQKGIRGYLFNAASHVIKDQGKRLDAKRKRIPDDTMDATAGLIYLADNPDMIEPSLRFF